MKSMVMDGFLWRCFCNEAGKCTGVIKPDTNFFSDAEFSYVILTWTESKEQFVYVNVQQIDDAPDNNVDRFWTCLLVRMMS